MVAGAGYRDFRKGECDKIYLYCLHSESKDFRLRFWQSHPRVVLCAYTLKMQITAPRVVFCVRIECAYGKE